MFVIITFSVARVRPMFALGSACDDGVVDDDSGYCTITTKLDDDECYRHHYCSG